MASLFWRLRRRKVVSGHVCTIRLVAMTPFNRESDDLLFRSFKELQGEFRERATELVKKHLGPEFEIEDVMALRGSLEVLVIIGSAYYAVSRYKSFIESFQLLASQLAYLLRRLLRNTVPPLVSVSGTVVPGPALAEFDAEPTPPEPLWLIGLLASYLVLSHAVLLAVVVYLVLGS